MKKTILILILTFPFFLSLSQEKEELSIFKNSKNWKREIIKFPIDWAPKLNISGFEELLFTPKWSDSKNDDFWSLIIGWKIDATSSLTIKDIEYNLKGYFDGLMKPNHWATKFPEPEVHLKRGKNGFSGKMTFFDGFHTGKTTTVNIQGSQQLFKNLKKSIISFRLPPKDYQHKIWKELKKIKLQKNIYYE